MITTIAIIRKGVVGTFSAAFSAASAAVLKTNRPASIGAR